MPTSNERFALFPFPESEAGWLTDCRYPIEALFKLTG
jgi:hypothetical protein